MLYTADSESAGDHTPVRRKAHIAPRVVKIAARFRIVGGSLDRRSGLTDMWVEDSPVRFGLESPAGDLALPTSTTWSNNTIWKVDSTNKKCRYCEQCELFSLRGTKWLACSAEMWCLHCVCRTMCVCIVKS